MRPEIQPRWGPRWLFPTSELGLRRRNRVLALLFVALAALLVGRALRKDGGVLVRNREFGQRFLAGHDPYEDPVRGHRIHGPYPPSLALVAAPLALVPEPAARLGWALAQVACLLLLYRASRRSLQRLWPEAARDAPVYFTAGLLLTSRFLLRDTAGGGGNTIVLTLAWLGVEAALARAPLHRTWLLGLSWAIKPTLAPLALLLLARRRFAGLGFAGATALFCALLPALFHGPEPSLTRYLELETRWVQDVLRFVAVEDLHGTAEIPDGMPAAENAMNQSLRAAVFRLLRPPGASGAPDVHIVTMSAAFASGLARALGLLLVIVSAWTAWRARSPRAEQLAALAFLALAFLISPISWKAHAIVLLPALIGLAAIAHIERRRGLALALASYWLSGNLLSQELIGRSGKTLLQAISLVTWLNLALFVVLLVQASSQRSNASNE